MDGLDQRVDNFTFQPGADKKATDFELLAGLPGSVDPCGERGEFHTFVSAGPMLSEPVRVTPGVIVEREGFVYADLTAV